MKNALLSITLLLAFQFMAFTTTEPVRKKTLNTGTYGIYSNNSTTLIQLKINEDFTFHYINNSNPEKPVNVKGNWTLTGNTLSLKDYSSGFQMNDKWVIDKNEVCLKSRKGIEFTRLCLINADI